MVQSILKFGTAVSVIRRKPIWESKQNKKTRIYLGEQHHDNPLDFPARPISSIS
jgi:hypothetical protein